MMERKYYIAMIKCPMCGEEMDDKEVKWPACGHDLKEEINPTPKKRGRPKKINTIKCEDCGIDFDSGLSECPNCGCPAPRAIVKENLPEPTYMFCAECGSKIPQNSTECPKCGYPIGTNNTKLIPTPIEKPKKIKKDKTNHNTGKVFFYIFLVLFFLAGCFTAVVISSSLKSNNNDKKDNNPIEYKINKTLSCINSNNNEEHNYYFDNNKLVQYSRYSIKDYETDSKANAEMKAFKNKWENDSSSSIISVHKKETKVIESLVVDLINSNNIDLEDDITLKDSLTKVKQKLQDNGYTCQEYNEDLGTNIPINEIDKETND